MLLLLYSMSFFSQTNWLMEREGWLLVDDDQDFWKISFDVSLENLEILLIWCDRCFCCCWFLILSFTLSLSLALVLCLGKRIFWGIRFLYRWSFLPPLVSWGLFFPFFLNLQFLRLTFKRLLERFDFLFNPSLRNFSPWKIKKGGKK